MTEKLTVSLFGHRIIEDAQFVEQKLYELLRIIIQGNRDMVDRSDLVVVYVKNNSGGAYQTLQYAEKNEKRIVNLYHTRNEEQ